MSLGQNLLAFLYNLELKIVDSKARLELANAEIETTINKTSKKYAENIIQAKAYETYVKQLEEVKNNELQRLEEVLSKYNPTYKTIWKLRFIDRLAYQEIADRTNYSRDRIRQIVQKLKNEMEGYFD